MIPILNGSPKITDNKEGMGYELFEMKAFIQGNWKLLRLPKPFGSGAWQLYNLKQDSGEINDVSSDNPEIKEDLIKAWQKYADKNEVFDHKRRFDALYQKVYGSN